MNDAYTQTLVCACIFSSCIDAKATGFAYGKYGRTKNIGLHHKIFIFERSLNMTLNKLCTTNAPWSKESHRFLANDRISCISTNGKLLEIIQ